jgi:hypothetical protein
MSVFGKIARLPKKLDGIIATNLQPEYGVSPRKIRRKMVFAKAFCGMDYMLFFRYHCERSSLRQITQRVLFNEQYKLWTRINGADSSIVLDDKYKAYLHFKEFYRRDVVFVNSDGGREEFLSFCHSHPRFIVKPLSRACGEGIQLIDTNEDSFSVDDYLNLNPDGFVAEELIKQDEALSQLHPESVNTLRINTVNYGSSIEVIWPCLRMGRGKSVVDNAGAGGVFGAIDIATGLISSVSDEHNHTFTKHPDTGIQLIGFKVPKWEEACEMAKHLAELIPDCHFVGWDLALTDNGWVMIEGNHNPYIIYQIATGKGIRKEFNRMKRRLLKK